MSIRSLTFQVVALVAIPAFAAYHGATPYDFTFSSFAREGVITLRTEGEARGDDYHLGEETSTTEGTTTIQTPVFDRAIDVSQLVAEGHLKGDETLRPIAYIPQEITLTSIAIVTPGTVAPENLILTLEGGKPHTLTLDRTKTPETITLHGTWQGAVGTRSGVVHTYTVDAGETVVLNPGTEHSVFSVAFQSSDEPGQAQNRNVYCLDGRPYLRIAGKATLEHHIFKIDAAVNPDHSEAQSLAALLASDPAHSFVDDPNTVIVVEFEGEGGGISLDKEVLDSPLVFGSSVTSDKAHIHFPGKELITGAITFRDGATKGGISIYGPTDTESYEDALWNPSAMLLRCNLTLRTPLPPLEGNWFLTHSTTIPAGRTFRIEVTESVDNTDYLPNLDFAAADSVLELALAGNLRPPTKYVKMMEAQSGTLVFDQNVTWPAAFPLGGEGLESTLILRDGHTYAFTGSRQGGGIETLGGNVTLIQEGGTLTLGSASNAPLTLEAEETVIEVRGGTMTCASALTVATEGSNTVIDVIKGGTLALNAGLPAGAEGTTATLDLTVKGTLNLGADLNMLPALRRELRLEGGTLAATGAAVSVNCKDGAAAEVEDFMIVSGGGTLTGALTVDGISGASSETNPLTINAGATVKDLRDFAGTVSGAGRLEAIEGTLGDVTLGDTWLANATGKKLGDVLTGWTEDGTTYHGAADFSGTIGFTAGSANAQKKLDFSNLDELTSLGMAFRINNHQHIVMRLDQYADAVIRWPDNPEGITLTLIESGAYGGELTLPHFPHTEGEETGVTFEFAYFNPSAPLGYTVRTEGYTHGHSEDGVNDTLVWDNPVFTGEGAWIDVEFDGTSANTGWFNLVKQNGCLVGVEGQPDYGAVTANDKFFVAMGHPVSEGMTLGYRPYVAESALPSFPEEWSLAVRMTAPSSANKCILAIGNNYANATASTYSLVFATGAVEADGTTEIVLWKFDGRADGAAQPAQDLPAEAIRALFRVKVADAQSAPHVFSVVCDGETLNLYMDGAWLNAIVVLPNQALSGGLQLGQQLGGSRVSASALERAGNVNVADGGAVDYIRFYKGAFPDAAMVEMADRTPYVRENLRYVRYVPITTDPRGTLTVPKGGETWIQDGAWLAETWNGSAWESTNRYTDEPAEGAYIRLLVDEGDHALQVNVERRDDAYFYSTDRNYAALVVEPQEGNAAAGTVRLVPYGVNPGTLTGEGDALTQAIDDAVTGSAWYTTPAASTAANRTGFQYGKLRFTGGAYDPITEGDPTATTTFYGSAYLLGGTTVTVTGQDGAIDWNGSIQREATDFWGSEGTCTQTGTRTLTYTYSANANQAVRLIFDGGVSYFSKYADMVVNAASIGTRKATETWQRSGTWSLGWNGYNYTWTADSETFQSTSSPTDELTEREQVNTLQAVAGMALTRGESAEVMDWQLSGPVFIEGEGEVKNGTVRGNPNAGSDQNSLDVWTVAFNANSTWKFFDDTRIEANGGEANAHGALGAGQPGETATRGGLFARGVQTPGRLYLDFTATEGPAKYGTTQAFSAQAWYRYGYEGNQDTTTEAGLAPTPASETDYNQAVAFQIRLDSEIGDVTLDIDRIPKARVQTFHVEEEAGTTDPLTLKLTLDEGVAPLPIWDTVVAAARLDVSNDKRVNALNLRPEGNASTRRTPVHRGNTSHDHGAYIVGTTLVDWDFGAASSVPRLEVVPGAELSFTVGQDFRTHGTTIVAQGKDKRTYPPIDGSVQDPTKEDLTSAAWIHHMSGAPFLGVDVVLGEGAIFGFHAEADITDADVQNEGVVLSGELRLTGNATLRADYNNVGVEHPELRIPHFIASGGIRATEKGITLIVDAPSHQVSDGNKDDVAWHSHTSEMVGDEDRPRHGQLPRLQPAQRHRQGHGAGGHPRRHHRLRHAHWRAGPPRGEGRDPRRQRPHDRHQPPRRPYPRGAAPLRRRHHRWRPPPGLRRHLPRQAGRGPHRHRRHLRRCLAGGRHHHRPARGLHGRHALPRRQPRRAQRPCPLPAEEGHGALGLHRLDRHRCGHLEDDHLRRPPAEGARPHRL